MAPADQAIIDAVMRAFRAPDVTQEKVEALRTVAKAAKVGTLSAADAAKAAKEIAPSLGELWKWLNAHGVAIDIVTLILTVLLWYFSDQSSNQAAATAHADQMQAHQDAQAALIVQHRQLEVEKHQLQEQQRESEVQRKIYEILAAQRQTAAMRESPQQPSHGKIAANAGKLRHLSLQRRANLFFSRFRLLLRYNLNISRNADSLLSATQRRAATLDLAS